MPPSRPRPGSSGNSRPANIYNGVLKPTIGYGIRGAIWYQGESNAGRAYQYRDLFPLMIQSWRDEWGIGDFPFYWVQLADFITETTEPGDSSWAELREAQTMTMDRLKNTGQAVILDLGRPRTSTRGTSRTSPSASPAGPWRGTTACNVPYRSPTSSRWTKQGDSVVLTLRERRRTDSRPFDVPEVRGFTWPGATRSS